MVQGRRLVVGVALVLTAGCASSAAQLAVVSSSSASPTSSSSVTSTAPPAVSPPADTPSVPAGGAAPSAAGSTPATAGHPTGAPPSSEPAVVRRGDGVPVLVPGVSPASGPGPTRTFSVAVEGGLGIDAAAFAEAVTRTLADPRSWGAGGRLSFRRVDTADAQIRVVLASPDTADRLCEPLDTDGIYSCGVGNRAVINAMRWLRGADAYAGHLAEYRQYVVNHEVGHTLGHGHQGCPGAGRPAPVMMQQTKGVGACLPTPWPVPLGNPGAAASLSPG